MQQEGGKTRIWLQADGLKVLSMWHYHQCLATKLVEMWHCALIVHSSIPQIFINHHPQCTYWRYHVSDVHRLCPHGDYSLKGLIFSDFNSSHIFLSDYQNEGHFDVLLDAVEGRLYTYRNERARVSLKGRQLGWPCDDDYGLPSTQPSFSLEKIGCMPCEALGATEVFQSCEQVCGFAICTTPTSGSELSKAVLQTNQKISLWLSPWRRGMGYLGRVHFIFFSEHLGQKSSFLQKSPTNCFVFMSKTSSSRPQELVTNKCPHFKSVAEFVKNLSVQTMSHA